jgi:hypothetical protein
MGEHPRQNEDPAATDTAPETPKMSLIDQLRPLVEDLHGMAHHQADQNAPVSPAMLERIEAIRELVG